MLSQDQSFLQQVIYNLENKFKAKLLGELSYCLGISFVRNKNTFYTHQKQYIIDLLEKFNDTNCKSKQTPVEMGFDWEKEIDGESFTETEARSAIGSLLYLVQCCRPDLAYAVGKASQYMHKPTPALRLGISRIFRYLKDTINFGLKFSYSSDALAIKIYSDADWAGDKSTRRSTSGCCTFLNGCLISWYSKKQATVVLSTMEAEYVSA